MGTDAPNFERWRSRVVGEVTLMSHDGATGVDIMASAGAGEEGAVDHDCFIHLVGVC